MALGASMGRSASGLDQAATGQVGSSVAKEEIMRPGEKTPQLNRRTLIQGIGAGAATAALATVGQAAAVRNAAAQGEEPVAGGRPLTNVTGDRPGNRGAGS